MEVTRRVFSTAAVAAAFSPLGKAKMLEPLSPGIKISMQVDENVSDDDLTWIKQMGVDYLNVQTGNGRATLDNFMRIKQRMEAAGLKVWNIPNNENRNIEEITLNLPGRDQRIEWLKQYMKTEPKLHERVAFFMRRHKVDWQGGYDRAVTEVSKFLTNGSKYFHDSDADNVKRTFPYRVIYRMPKLQQYVRLVNKTADWPTVEHLHESLERAELNERAKKHRTLTEPPRPRACIGR